MIRSKCRNNIPAGNAGIFLDISMVIFNDVVCLGKPFRNSKEQIHDMGPFVLTWVNLNANMDK